MRVKALLKGDIKFQIKYGFYFIYLIFTVLYIGLLSALPVGWRQTGGLLMIFSDPAAMGLYFMGAIVLFEKSERVLDSVAVSPVKPWEYVLSKLVSVAVVSTLVAAAIGFAAGIDTDIFRFFISIFLCSCLFSSVGLIVATKISTLNGFIVATIPAELIINIPAVAWLFGYQKAWLLFHPGVCMITLCSDGKYNFSAMVILIFWTVLFAVLASRAVGKMMRSVGAIKL